MSGAKMRRISAKSMALRPTRALLHVACIIYVTLYNVILIVHAFGKRYEAAFHWPSGKVDAPCYVLEGLRDGATASL